MNNSIVFHTFGVLGFWGFGVLGFMCDYMASTPPISVHEDRYWWPVFMSVFPRPVLQKWTTLRSAHGSLASQWSPTTMVHARRTQRLSLEDFPPSRVAVNVNISETEHCKTRTPILHKTPESLSYRLHNTR